MRRWQRRSRLAAIAEDSRGDLSRRPSFWPTPPTSTTDAQLRSPGRSRTAAARWSTTATAPGATRRRQRRGAVSFSYTVTDGTCSAARHQSTDHAGQRCAGDHGGGAGGGRGRHAADHARPIAGQRPGQSTLYLLVPTHRQRHAGPDHGNGVTWKCYHLHGR